MDGLQILTWLAAVSAVLLFAACLAWIGWEEYVRWSERKERRAVHAAIRASFARRKALVGDTLIDEVHQQWDSPRSTGPRGARRIR